MKNSKRSIFISVRDVIANSKFTFLVIYSECSLSHQDNIIDFFLQTLTIQGCHYYKLRFSCTFRNKRFFVDVEEKHDILLSIGGLKGVENFFSFSCSFLKINYPNMPVKPVKKNMASQHSFWIRHRVFLHIGNSRISIAIFKLDEKD